MKKHLTPGNLLFALLLALLLLPQTRTPIQVAVNKLKLLVWSPSELDTEDQTQLQPFSYKLADLNGTPKAIDIGKGKPTFLSYWATWCPPCIAELPSIQKLYTDYGDKINFILLTQENPETVTRFLEKNDFELPVYNPRMRTPEGLSSHSLPTNYIIDGEGKVIIKETGASDWNSERVREVLQGLVD